MLRLLYRPNQAKNSRRAWPRSASQCCETSSLFKVAKNGSTTLLSQHFPSRPADWRIRC